MKCRTATLYYPLAPSNNTLGSPHIFQAFPGPSPFEEYGEKICVPNNTAVCIGDTYIFSNTLYADKGLTQQVAKLFSKETVVDVGGGGGVGLTTGSIFYEDTKAELIYSGSGAVSGGTKECAMASGTFDVSSASGDNYGSVAFHLAF